MTWYYYIEPADQEIVRIRASRRPSKETRPRRTGAWYIEEYSRSQRKWIMPVCPEVTWGMVRTFLYLGKDRINP